MTGRDVWFVAAAVCLLVEIAVAVWLGPPRPRT